MKQFYTLILFCLAFRVGAQPTITSADAPGPGTTFSLRVGTWSAQQETGPGSVWDYSGAGGGTPYLFEFAEASTSPYFATFPEATMVMTGDGNHTFFSADAAGLYTQGYHGLFTEVVMTDPMTQVHYPMGTMTSWDESYSGMQGSVFFMGDADCNANGSGTLILPWGSVEDVLRLRLVNSPYYFSTPQLGVIDTVDLYYKSGFPWYLLRATKRWSEQGGIVQPYQYTLVYATEESVVGIEENRDDGTGLEVYPNPAEDIVMIDAPTSAPLVSAEIFDALGRSRSIGQERSTSTDILHWQLDVHDWEPGVYVLRLRYASGLSGQRKFIVR